ncbi:MAG: radical SAM protein [Candidatus Omnitrophica bacterium]|nr:radical SAM protein [Candidatus Omnitrophota bacterium]
MLRFLRTAMLYLRVGLSGVTPKKAYVMIRYWILTTIFKKDIPWILELSVTYLCNCRCKHCSVSNYFEDAKPDGELSTDELGRILSEAVAMGIPKVDFFGGEPLIRKDIVALVRKAAQLGLYSSVTTNGWFLTPAMIKDLKEAGISCLNVSLDDVTAESHDRSRGAVGVFDKAVAAIRACHEQGVACIVSTYVTRRKIEHFEAGEKDASALTAIIRLSKQLKATGIRILFPIIAGEWVKQKDVELTEKEKEHVIAGIDPAFAFIEGAYSVSRQKKVCQALKGKLVNISPRGELQLCVAFPHVFGNVKDMPLEDAIRKMWQHPIYRKNMNDSCCSTEDLKV